MVDDTIIRVPVPESGEKYPLQGRWSQILELNADGLFIDIREEFQSPPRNLLLINIVFLGLVLGIKGIDLPGEIDLHYDSMNVGIEFLREGDSRLPKPVRELPPRGEQVQILQCQCITVLKCCIGLWIIKVIIGIHGIRIVYQKLEGDISPAGFSKDFT